jgi:hypothetical protein
MIFKMSSLHKFFFTYICPRFYGGAPSTPSQTTQTVNQNTIPAELMPYVKNMLNRAEPLSQAAYKPYSTNAADYVAPFSPMQKQAQAGAANLQTPGQFAPASTMAGLSGLGSMTAGAQYAQQATDPNSVGAYMNPYLQQSLAPQLQLLNQQYGIEQAKQQGAATQAGAFGGSREALMSGLNSQNQNLAQQKMISEGYNQAFNQAQQAQQFGANLGLQGYNQGIQAAGQLGQLGTQQLAADTSVLGTQAQFGAQQQAQQQQAIDQAVQNYQNAQNYPYMQLGFMSNLLRGTPTGNTTQTVYQAQPSAMQQIGGALGTAGSLYGAYTAKAEGGIIQDNGYAKGGIVGYFGGGSVEESMRSKLEDLDVSHLQQIIQSNESPEMSKLAKEVLATKFAKGGIVAFANGGQSQDWKSALENISQEMTARDYKLHGWTDEDIINYKSSGRVPLDPKKQLALRTPEAGPRIPLDKDIYYKRLQEKGRRVPEDKVIRLPDENAVKPNTFEPVSSDKGIAGYRPAAEYKPPQYGGELGAPPKEGEYIPSEKSTARGAIGAPEQEPIEGRKMYYDETKAYKDAMEQRRADMAAGKKAPPDYVVGSKEQKAWKDLQAKRAKEGLGQVELKSESPVGDAEVAPKTSSKGLTAIKGLAPVALKTLGTLSLPELVDTMTGQPEDSKTFKEYEAIKKKSGMKGVLAHMNEQVAEGNAKVAKGIAAFASENISEPVKEWWSGEEGQTQQPVTPTAVTPSAPAGIDSQAQAPLQKQESPYSADAYNPVYTQRKQPAVTPPAGGAGQGIVQKEQPSFGGTPEESEILRANLASEPESVAQAVNTTAEVANAKTEQDMGFYQKQVAEMYKQAGLGNNEGAAAMRKEIMDELANKEANEKRQTYLRMAEFFSHWGSTPGAPLAAGMRSLIATMPGYLEDKKDQEKLQRGLQDSLYKLDQADRLEKIGMIKEAAALKHEASQFDKEVMKLQHEAIQNRLQEDAAERRAKIMAGASTTNAVIGATSRIDGTTSDTYRGNNIKALQNQATNITRQMANLLPESKELPGLKAQLKNVNDRMDALIDESGAKPKTRYDRWLTETGKI